VVRQGKLVYTWGDATKPGDVASAVKPFFAHFLLRALADKRIPALDEKVVRWEPRLTDLNASLGHKDREITWRHMANQVSCYGLAERPGTAFCYNDWQMALFADLLFRRVYQVDWPDVDAKILHPLLTNPLGCEDRPTLVAFGTGIRAGRLAISPRDFARFGQLYLQHGRWNGTSLLREDLARMAVTSPLPASLPRAGNLAAEMLPSQRTLGSQKIPDNQTDHFGSYSWLWWINGIQRDGERHWPDAPTNTFAALGHGGKRGMAVMPSLALIASWNDSRIDSPEKENEAFRLLTAAVQETK
jgi:CubicO group peptidase (beta-lactamase class C family)